MSAVFDDYRAWKSWDRRPFGACSPLQACGFEAELTAAGVDLGKQLSILEIGFGSGVFAGWARDRGFAYVGVELDPELVARARQCGFEAFGAGRPLAQVAPERRFDLVAAFDVLEHMSPDEIAGLLDAVRPRLSRQGRLLARFPSGDSPFSAAMQHGDLTHRTAIGSGMVEQLALQAGYDLLQVRAPTRPIRGVGLIRGLRRAAVAAVRVMVTEVVRWAFYDGHPRRVIDPNMVVVLAPAGPR